ncbi:MAG: diaminopimelate decarboxylase, partial [Bacteroidota bacterium]
MEIRDNAYYLGGLKTTDLAEKYGSPLYLYDLETIKRQYDRITKAFSKSKVRINFACKALTNINILKYFNELGAGLDAVSIQEVWLGLQAGFKPADIMYTPNCVSMDEIDLAVKEGVKINIDNISILEQFGHKYGESIP